MVGFSFGYAEGAKDRGGAEKRFGLNAKGAKSSKGRCWGMKVLETPACSGGIQGHAGAGDGTCMAPGSKRCWVRR